MEYFRTDDLKKTDSENAFTFHSDVSKRKRQILQVIHLYYTNRQIMKYYYNDVLA